MSQIRSHFNNKMNNILRNYSFPEGLFGEGEISTALEISNQQSMNNLQFKKNYKQQNLYSITNCKFNKYFQQNFSLQFLTTNLQSIYAGKKKK
ncbi:hypothetical protein Bhyg_09921 [Pseudolycoriella hygida]|uniref:Uncharacterized protein n=1 Tax=Pseudolycoriella hygida TaxID=35572 RepID=A0A9Q0MSH1_9DIPT|nr:hypothetical protein Bhyg_09921 [Pseudolycoriella hygida]